MLLLTTAGLREQFLKLNIKWAGYSAIYPQGILATGYSSHSFKHKDNSLKQLTLIVHGLLGRACYRYLRMRFGGGGLLSARLIMGI